MYIKHMEESLDRDGELPCDVWEETMYIRLEDLIAMAEVFGYRLEPAQ